MEKVMFTVKEVADYLNCSESAIRKLKTESKIPHFRLGKKILFEKRFINQWLYKNQIMSIDLKDNELIVKTFDEDNNI